MIRKSEMQIEHMEQANVRVGYSARRPVMDIELEHADERTKHAILSKAARRPRH